jgi:hypothetical protein
MQQTAAFTPFSQFKNCFKKALLLALCLMQAVENEDDR